MNRSNSIHSYASDGRVANAQASEAVATTSGTFITNSENTEKSRKSPAINRSEAIAPPYKKHHKKQIEMESSTISRNSASYTGENSVRDISVVSPNAVEVRCAAPLGFREMPYEILHNIFSRLNLRDIVVIKSTFEAADRVVNDILRTESKRWFSSFSTLQQAKSNKIAEGIDDQVLRTWLGQFTEEEKVVKYLLENRHHCHFPELFFYTVSRLMADCQAFKAELIVTIKHTGIVHQATFSDDGNHIMTQSKSGQCKIYTLSPDGQWVEKTTVCHNERVFRAKFSGDGKHVVTMSCDRQAKIHTLDSDGNWIEENNLHQEGASIRWAVFSPDGLRVAIIDNTYTLRIHGRGTDGTWTEETNSSGSRFTYPFPPSFNRYGNELMVTVNKEVLPYCRDLSGRWETKTALTGGCPWVEQEHFSPNDDHMVTIGNREGKVKIFGRDANGNWIKIKQVEIHPIGFFPSVEFSANSRCLVISANKATAIYHLATNGSWTEMAILKGRKLNIPATFSFDNRYLAIHDNDDTVTLYGLGADGQCTEKTRIDRAQCAFFSTNGNHILVFHTKNPNGNVRFYGLSQDGKLVLKATFDHGKPICSATISPTGRYLVTCGDDAKAKIWLLSSSA